MESKVIWVREDVYNKLRAMKKHGENFSELLERLVDERKKDPLAHFGLWKDENEKDFDEFETSLQEARAISRGLTSNKYNFTGDLRENS